jgi:hypothetical protein
MQKRTQTVETVTVGVAGGRAFDAALYRDADGQPMELILSVGFASEATWRERASVLRLPADALPAIREALHLIDARGAS